MPALDPLIALGLDPERAATIGQAGVEFTPGRVIRSDRGFVFAYTAAGIVMARPSTHLVKSADDGGMPVVGDWVLLGGTESEPLVERVLERTTSIARRDPGRAARVQVLAANVDVVLVTHPLSDGAPNLARIERELSLVWDSGSQPVVVLTKADLHPDLPAAVAAVEAAAPGVTVLTTSTVTGEGIEDIRSYLSGGQTIVLIGPSGSGKSTLVNALAGEDIQATREVRVSDHRGRHTTVSRELLQLPGGGLVIDTPGLRAVGMWDSADGVDQAFSDVALLAEGCRFRDCRHDGEPGCAVEAAVASGELPARRLESYRELRAEALFVGEQLDARARLERKREGKQLARAIKRYYKDGPRGT
ncbi:MAG: ribosome small subunit-dependent GTPase A [Coriobacteriia bacterium]